MRAAIWWSAAAGTLLAMNAWLAAGRNFPGDRELLVMAHAWRNSSLDSLFSGLTWFGSALLLLPLALAIASVFWRRGHRGDAGFVIAAVAGAVLLAEVAKRLLLRARPDLFAALVPAASSWSLPSAHAMQSMAILLALVLSALRLSPGSSLRAILPMVAVLILVGLSRVYLQVHFPSDVIAGWIVGACWVAGLRLLVPRQVQKQP